MSLKHATIGTVIHGTLLDTDLLEAFWNELEWQLQRQERTPENRDELDKLHAVLGRVQDDCWDEDGNVIERDDLPEIINEELMPVLDAFAPPYCYFGAHAGDGSDFGYWPAWDSIDELPKFDDLADVPEDIDEDYTVVNDHGNVTVYSAQGKAVLELV